LLNPSGVVVFQGEQYVYQTRREACRWELVVRCVRLHFLLQAFAPLPYPSVLSLFLARMVWLTTTIRTACVRTVSSLVYVSVLSLPAVILSMNGTVASGDATQHELRRGVYDCVEGCVPAHRLFPRL
jgi:hypothetical protein